jgi:hypothetical protein
MLPRTAPEEEDTATRLTTPCGAAVTMRLAQKMLADYCGKLPGADRWGTNCMVDTGSASS